jgi:hypothetical protein
MRGLPVTVLHPCVVQRSLLLPWLNPWLLLLLQRL